MVLGKCRKTRLNQAKTAVIPSKIAAISKSDSRLGLREYLSQLSGHPVRSNDHWNSKPRHWLLLAAVTEAPMDLAPTILLLGALVLPAKAAVTTQSLSAVGVMPIAGARLPLLSAWRDEDDNPLSLGQAIAGKPALVLFADYTCSTLCGPALAFVADALANSHLATKDYRLIVLGLDPKDKGHEAAAFRKARVGDLALPIVMLTAPESVIKATTISAGYNYVYDVARDQYAHPAAIIAAASDGRIIRVLSSLGFNPSDLTLAIAEAGQGSVGRISDQVRLLCYGFDPASGTYNFAITRALGASAALTVIALGTCIAWLMWRARGSRAP
jgi:protein SCO1/2